VAGDGSHGSRAMANGLSAEEAEAMRQMQEEATQRSNGVSHQMQYGNYMQL